MAENDAAYGLPANMPESLRARLMAARLLQQGAAQQTAPYTSGAVVGLKAIEGLMGGLQERQAINEARQGQMAGNTSLIDLANALRSGAASGIAGSGGVMSSAGSSPLPAAFGTSAARVGSDAVASGSARNPAGYDPAAARDYILARAPAYGISPDAAHAIARSEGLNVYVGDKGSSFGPFQLHYGGVAGGGNSVGGLGDDFTRQTGLDARDPSTVKQQIDFSLAHAAQNGWGPWHGRQTAGMGVWDGINRGSADPSLLQAAYKGAATPSAAPTTSTAAAAPSGQIGDAAALAAQNRIASGQGSDADRALLVSYRQQQNTPQLAAQNTAAADVPAPNAQAVASSSLPPGITPDMLNASGTPPSPYGSMPTSMAQPPATPDAATMAAALRGQAPGSGPGATPLPAAMQSSSPFGAMPTDMAQASASVPTPSMVGAPPPSPMPSPFGAAPQPMAPQGGADPAMVAALLKSGAQTPAAGSQAPDPSLMQAAAPGAPQTPPLSPNAVAMGDLMAGGPGPAALDPTAGAQPAASLSTGQLPGMDNFSGTPDGSVRQTSIVDPSDPNSTPGFTGSFGPGIQPQISGTLPPPDMLAQGSADMPSPASPSPAVMAAALRNAPPAPAPTSSPAPPAPSAAPPPPNPAGQQAAALLPGGVDDFGRPVDPSDVAGNTTRAMQAAGMDTTGLPGAQPKPVAPPLPMLAGADVPPPADPSAAPAPTPTPTPAPALPIMARQSSNPPAALRQDFAGLGQPQPPAVSAYSTEPTSRPGAQAARNLAAGVPTPPPRPSDAALGLDPDAPAPNAVPAGPAPVSPQMMGSLLRQQPMGLAGNSPTSDPSSAVSFNRQEALRAQGFASPAARVLAGQGTAPASQPQGGGSPFDAIGRIFGMGGQGGGLNGVGQGSGIGGMLSGLPLIGGMLGNGQGGQMGNGFPIQGQQSGASPTSAPASSPAYGGQGQGQGFTPGGQGGQPGQGGAGSDRAISAAQAILNNPYASPIAQEQAAKILFPQVSTVTGADGKVYAFNPATRQMSLLGDVGAKFTPNESLYQGGRFTQAPAGPMDVTPGNSVVSFGANNVPSNALRTAPTPDFKPVEGTNAAMDSRSGQTTALPPGGGGFNTSIKLPGGTEVPIRVTPGQNGGQPRVEYLTPGTQGGANATSQGNGPLGAVQPLVDQAQGMQAQGAAQTKEAEGQVAQLGDLQKQGLEARQMIGELNDLKALSAKVGAGGGPMLSKWLGDHGYVTKDASDVAAMEGLQGYLATRLRQAGSGPLRNAELDRFNADIGNLKMTPDARAAAIDRVISGFQRQADYGAIAGNSQMSPAARMGQVQTLAGLPLAVTLGQMGQAGAQPGAGQVPATPPTAAAAPPQAAGNLPTVASPADAMRLPPGTRFRDPSGQVRVVPGAAR